MENPNNILYYDTLRQADLVYHEYYICWDESWTNEIIAMIIFGGEQKFERTITHDLSWESIQFFGEKVKQFESCSEDEIIQGLIIVPPNRSLSKGFLKLMDNQYHSIIDDLDIIIFGNEYPDADFQSDPNLVNLVNFIHNAKTKRFTGLKRLDTVRFHHFTEKAYEDFCRRKIISNKTHLYKKSLYTKQKLKQFVHMLKFVIRIPNLIIEIQKQKDLYTSKKKILYNLAGFDIVLDSPGCFVMVNTKWDYEDCSRIIKSFMQAFVTNYHESNIDIFVNDILQNYETIGAAYKNHYYSYENQFIFSPNILKYRLADTNDKIIMGLLAFCTNHLGIDPIIINPVWEQIVIGLSSKPDLQ